MRRSRKTASKKAAGDEWFVYMLRCTDGSLYTGITKDVNRRCRQHNDGTAYRNHAFFVTTPDGKTTLLRPEEILQRDKNAPHPVEITAKGPYHLPNWVEGDTLKSLKTLGLDTTTPGTYTITGLYEETGKEADNPKGGKTQMWGGSITSNTVTVEVKKEAAGSK